MCAVCAATISQFVELKQASLQGLCKVEPDGNMPSWDAGTWLPWDEVEDANCKSPPALKLPLAFFLVLLLACRAPVFTNKRSRLRIDHMLAKSHASVMSVLWSRSRLRRVLYD